MGWIGGGSIMFIGLIVIALLVYGFYNMTQKKGQSNSYEPGFGTSDTGKAMRILNERYAHGEIDDEEYKRTKATLNNY